MRVCHFEILFMNESCGDILAENDYEYLIENNKNIDLISREMIIELEDLDNYIESLK